MHFIMTISWTENRGVGGGLNFSTSIPLNLILATLLQLMVWFYNDNLELGEIYFLYNHLKIDDNSVQRSFDCGIYYVSFRSTPMIKLT